MRVCVSATSPSNRKQQGAREFPARDRAAAGWTSPVAPTRTRPRAKIERTQSRCSPDLGQIGSARTRSQVIMSSSTLTRASKASNRPRAAVAAEQRHLALGAAQGPCRFHRELARGVDPDVPRDEADIGPGRATSSPVGAGQRRLRCRTAPGSRSRFTVSLRLAEAPRRSCRGGADSSSPRPCGRYGSGDIAPACPAALVFGRDGVPLFPLVLRGVAYSGFTFEVPVQAKSPSPEVDGTADTPRARSGGATWAGNPRRFDEAGDRQHTGSRRRRLDVCRVGRQDFYALRPDGTLAWRFRTGGIIDAAGAIERYVKALRMRL